VDSCAVVEFECLPSATNIDAAFPQRDAIPIDPLMRIAYDEEIRGRRRYDAGCRRMFFQEGYV
jgi:hypothetical protein